MAAGRAAGGVVALAVPDKRATFDAARPSTTLEHVERDHGDGPAWSRRAHYEEYARLVEGLGDADAGTRAAILEAEAVDIHFHVWTRGELVAFLLHLGAAHDLPFEIELIQANGMETLVVLRRT